MANIPLKSIKYPGLPDTYTVPQVDQVPTQGSTNAVSSGGVYDALRNTDTTLSQSGKPADAKTVGDKIKDLINVLREPTAWISGKMITEDDAISGHSYYSCCDYVLIPPYASAFINVYFSGNARCILYNVDKSVNTIYQNTNASPQTIPYQITLQPSSERRYIRASTYTSNIADAYIIVFAKQEDIDKAVKGASRINSVSAFSDANSAEANSIYAIAVSGVANLPSEDTGTLVSFNYSVDSVSGISQVFISSTGSIYSRIKWGPSGGTWSAWKGYIDALEGSKFVKSVRRVDSVSALADANDALPNSIYTIAVYNIPNIPENQRGTLLTFSYQSEISSGYSQLFINDSGHIFTRIKWGPSGGTWSAWQSYMSEVSPSGYSGIGMFEKFGVIGDSYASGVIYTPGVSSDNEYYPLSWGQILAREKGNICINYSHGGYSTYDFVNSANQHYNTYGMGKLLNDISNNSKCGLYLLCLGINDSNNTRTFGDKTGGMAYLGSSEDVNMSDYTQNVNSFWGNYGKIIQQIKEASPSSKIVLCTFKRIPTTATSEAYEVYRSAIEEIADFFGLPCIKLDDDQFFNSTYYLNNMVTSHPTAPQYVGYAKGVERLLSKVMVSNYSYFKTYIGV